MTDPKQTLEALRRDLRELVLPRLEDEYVRSVVIAMLGILGDLAPRVRLDEDWCRASVEELRAGAEEWARALGGSPEGREIAELAGRAAAEASPGLARKLLLAAAEITLKTLWQEGRADPDPRFLDSVRSVLAADLRRELGKGRD
jgi:hypothetical protein